MKDYQKKAESDGQGELFNRRKSEIPDEERVVDLQRKLYQKAKAEKGFKFYVLYDKMFIPYMLREAWKQVKSNGGSAGIDKIGIKEIEQYGVENYLEELGEDLRKQTYRPLPVKRVMIPKANGGERPLGIPTVRDRIAQTVCKMILEPIFESDFEESSYGFRPKRSSKDAMRAIKEELGKGKVQVYDADLSNYFDSIPHDKLMIALQTRVSDPRILKLLKQWLKVPVQEDGQLKGGKGRKTGTPQGGVISPLLANVYMHLLDRIVNSPNSLFGKAGIKIIRYADDFILMGKELSEEVLKELDSILDRMGLCLNEQKTHKLDARDESFDFLGFTVRFDKDIYGRPIKYWNVIPSKKSEAKLREKVRVFLRTHGHSRPERVADGLNSLTRGWMNYFDIAQVSYPRDSYRRLRYYLTNKVDKYYRRKSQRRCKRLYGRDAFKKLVQNYGLIDPSVRTGSLTPFVG
jgi:RNA-directed DNA polymerase